MWDSRTRFYEGQRYMRKERGEGTGRRRKEGRGKGERKGRDSERRVGEGKSEKARWTERQEGYK